MEITARALWTLIHGLGFGALYLLACSGALVELYRFTTSSAPSEPTATQERFLKVYLLAMVVFAWAAVLTGAYVIYPWYRAAPPSGAADLSMFSEKNGALRSLNHIRFGVRNADVTARLLVSSLLGHPAGFAYAHRNNPDETYL